MTKALIQVLLLAAACRLPAAEGIEDEAAAAPQPVWRHLKATVWELRDRTDSTGELVARREWLLLPGTDAIDVYDNVVDMQDVVSGEGTVYLLLAPLPGSRDWQGPAFRLLPGEPAGIEVPDHPGRTLALPYSGGDAGRRKALMRAQRQVRPFVPGRDGLFVSNTWGDRNRDSRLCEKFMLGEIEAAAKLGVDVVQIDDGWQRGRTANSSDARGKGVWNGYWAADAQFWAVDPVRFPRGLAALAGAASARGMGLGLWFGPDSSNDAANWERDAALLLDYHRRFGIGYFKIDSLKTDSAVALRRQRSLFERVLEESGGRVVFDLDVTAERRPGYFGMPEIGPVFVENRYTDWHKYWPHQTLRQFWALCDVVDPVRLRMELLNPLRNRGLYAGDPLAPAEWPVESVFASVMLGSPLGWFEASSLAPETVARLAPFVAVWKRHRDRLHAGVVHPVGAKPDGVSWTGFVVEGERSLDVILFRELSGDIRYEIDLAPFATAANLAAAPRLVTLSPRSRSSLDGWRLTVEVPAPLDFVWTHLTNP